MTGTYRLAFRLYDSNTMIGEINRYIVIKWGILWKKN
jgi:hypothetical protein